MSPVARPKLAGGLSTRRESGVVSPELVGAADGCGLTGLDCWAETFSAKSSVTVEAKAVDIFGRLNVHSPVARDIIAFMAKRCSEFSL